MITRFMERSGVWAGPNVFQLVSRDEGNRAWGLGYHLLVVSRDKWSIIPKPQKMYSLIPSNPQ